MTELDFAKKIHELNGTRFKSGGTVVALNSPIILNNHRALTENFFRDLL